MFDLEQAMAYLLLNGYEWQFLVSLNEEEILYLYNEVWEDEQNNFWSSIRKVKTK